MIGQWVYVVHHGNPKKHEFLEWDNPARVVALGTTAVEGCGCGSCGLIEVEFSKSFLWFTRRKRVWVHISFVHALPVMEQLAREAC